VPWYVVSEEWMLHCGNIILMTIRVLTVTMFTTHPTSLVVTACKKLEGMSGWL
jgi:hypothetical protein